MFAIGALCHEISKLSHEKLTCTFENGAEGIEVQTIAPLEHATRDHVAFLAQSKWLPAAVESRAGVLVVMPEDAKAILEKDAKRSLVITANPYAWFAYALQIMTRDTSVKPGIHPKAFIDPTAKVDSSATIDAGAVVEAGAVIGARTHLFPGAFVGARTRVGEDTILYANATVYHDCKIGSRVILHSGSVIGADGFGFAPFAGEWVKIPQIGGVEIGDEVEIGANTTVDRGALENTVIGRGSKLDNQIQIAHNDKIGECTVMAACTGVAGSTTIGSHCMVGGASNINGHITIPDGVQVGPASNIMHWEEGVKVMAGYIPAQERRTFEKNVVLVRRLSDMRQKIKELEAKIEALESK